MTIVEGGRVPPARTICRFNEGVDGLISKPYGARA